MRLESDVKLAIKKEVTAVGGRHVAVVLTGYGEAGISDALCCIKGQFLAIEAKLHARMNKNNPTRRQREFLVSILKTGGRALVIHEKNLHVLRRVCREMAGLQ